MVGTGVVAYGISVVPGVVCILQHWYGSLKIYHKNTVIGRQDFFHRLCFFFKTSYTYVVSSSSRTAFKFFSSFRRSSSLNSSCFLLSLAVSLAASATAFIF